MTLDLLITQALTVLALTLFLVLVYRRYGIQRFVVWNIAWGLEFVRILIGIWLSQSFSNHLIFARLVLFAPESMLLLYGAASLIDQKRIRPAYIQVMATYALTCYVSVYQIRNATLATLLTAIYAASIYGYLTVTLWRFARRYHSLAGRVLMGVFGFWVLKILSFPAIYFFKGAQPFQFWTGTIMMFFFAVGMGLLVIEDYQRKLKASELKFRSLVEAQPESIIQISPEGSLMHVNKAGLRQFAGGEEIVVSGKNFKDILESHLASVLESALRKAADERSPGTFEYRQGKTGGWVGRIWDGYVLPISEAGDETDYFLCVIRDVTERKRLEAQLVQSAKLASIGELASGVAHEINNPLTPIIGYTELLLREKNEDTKESNVLQIILDQSRRISDIVKNLLAFAHPDSETFNEEDMGSIIEEAFTLVGHAFQKDGIDVDNSIDGKLPHIRCRRTALLQVFINLLNNARHALNQRFPNHHAEKRLEIRADTTIGTGRGLLRIFVRDAGIGIPEDVQAQIFDPFFTTKNRSEGTGLGLSVSYRIIEDHGGQIHMSSREGEYTQFCIELPVAQKGVAAPSSTEQIGDTKAAKSNPHNSAG